MWKFLRTRSENIFFKGVFPSDKYNISSAIRPANFDLNGRWSLMVTFSVLPVTFQYSSLTEVSVQ
jgi:hypothetical protein